MKIVFHHEHVLPVIKYGGIERIIYWHMLELVKQGHQVVLIGNEKSDVERHGIKLIPLNESNKANWKSLIPLDTDIVHLFYNNTVENFPTIVTIQGNGQPGETFPENTVFVSKKHAEIHNSDQFIYNALDLNEYPFEYSEKKWNRFLFLAKASWRVKNLKQIAKACRSAGKHLNVVGGRWFGISRYIHNLGMLGGDEKTSAIKECDALIFTVRWHEPFGIAIIEAMAHGLPVIGSPYGSLPELIKPEVGFIVKNYDELLEKLKNPNKTFDPRAVRKYIEDHFNISIHTKSYLEKYQLVIDGKKLNPNRPGYTFKQRAEELLPF